MTQFSKTHWVTDNDKIQVGVEFSKIDQQKRLVSGWATLDNVDTQNDIVTAEASSRAFSRARGNLREMHKKDSAVGHLVSFKEDEFRTPDGKKHRGIFVTAYVSKGAQDTWEKVLDKTLTGFSIGGDIVDSDEDFNKDVGSTVRIIKDYNLNELSLVDNPGNQYANVFSIQKSADGSVTVEGMAADTNVVNVFFCKEDHITKEVEDEIATCPACDSAMVNIGWIENTDYKKVNTLVKQYLAPDAADAENEGGVEVAKKENEQTDESVETGHEEGDLTEVPVPTDGDAQNVEEVSDETVEKAVEVEEVHDETEEIGKKIDELKEVVEKTLDANKQETSKRVGELEEKIDTLTKSFTEKASEFERKFEELDNNLETAKSRLSTFEKSLEKINAQGAFKKSIDSDESKETEQNTDPWAGSAFSVHSLIR